MFYQSDYSVAQFSSDRVVFELRTGFKGVSRNLRRSYAGERKVMTHLRNYPNKQNVYYNFLNFTYYMLALI